MSCNIKFYPYSACIQEESIIIQCMNEHYMNKITWNVIYQSHPNSTTTVIRKLLLVNCSISLKMNEKRKHILQTKLIVQLDEYWYEIWNQTTARRWPMLRTRNRLPSEAAAFGSGFTRWTVNYHFCVINKFTVHALTLRYIYMYMYIHSNSSRYLGYLCILYWVLKTICS
jgi:hypothetical protein